MKKRNCKDCRFIFELRHCATCDCLNRKDIKLSKNFNYKEAETCLWFDDENWLN